MGVNVDSSGKACAPRNEQRITSILSIICQTWTPADGNRQGAEPLCLFAAGLAHANAKNIQAVLAKVKHSALRRWPNKLGEWLPTIMLNVDE